MKVLFLSHYKNNDKFGIYAQGLMLALKKADVDIVFRHISNNKNETNSLHLLLRPLEGESLDGCTHCIQFLEPEYLLGTKKFLKNIAIIAEKGKSYNDLIFMDEVLVFEDEVKSHILQALPQIKVKTIVPPLGDIKDKLVFVYENSREIEFNEFSLDSVGLKIKEALSA